MGATRWWQRRRPAPVVYPPTLRDPAHEQAFRERGYTVVDLLDADAVATLIDVCRRFHPAPESTWECDFYSTDPECKAAVGAAIDAAFAGPVDHHLTGHRTFLHNFVLNWPGPDGGLELHQHSSTVDEREHRSAVVWCALTATDEVNGTLHVVPGSHHLQRGPKAERSPTWFEPHRAELIAHHLDAVELRPGQAIVFDNAVLHCSFENVGTTPRIAAVATVAPATAQLRFHEWADGWVDCYELDPSFFIESTPVGMQWARPEGLRPVERVRATPWVPTAAEVERALPAGACELVHHEQRPVRA